MFFQKAGVPFRDAKNLLEEYPFFITDIITEVMKQRQIEALENQILMAEAVRVGTVSKKNGFIQWLKSKERAIWKLRKTDEEKEKEALHNWEMLQSKQKQILTPGQPGGR